MNENAAVSSEQIAQAGEMLDLLEGALARLRRIPGHDRLGRDIRADPGSGGRLDFPRPR